jgi:diguanylate cyclase
MDMPIHPTPSPNTPAEAPADIAMADWGELLNAVTQRLDQTANEATLKADSRLGVLDCVAALGQLQHAAQLEFDRLARLELEAVFTRTALQLAQAELAGTRAGVARANHEAMHDGLTALPNRQTFRARLDEVLSHQTSTDKCVAVMYLDLDGFKTINDQHGHEVGDQLLCIVAERLRRTVRANDMLGRLGGDEFACLFTRIAGRMQLGSLARKLAAAVAAPITLGTLRLAILPSIGIAVATADVRSTTALLACADAAMYRAKRTHAGYAFYEPGADCAVSNGAAAWSGGVAAEHQLAHHAGQR